MKWEPIKKRDDGAVEIPDTWLLAHYYEALNVLFRIENAIRVFVYIVLKNEFKENWCTINVASDDAEESTIGKIAKRRMAQARTYGYLGYPIPCPLMYLTGGELIRLITSDGCWKHFSSHFLGDREIIRNKLDEIGNVRNAMAHFRPIKQDDVDVIKQNAHHVLSKVETLLTDIMRCPNIVPTNTQEEWYQHLRTLGTDLCSLSFKQSDSELWVRITIDYKCPILLKRTPLGKSRQYRILNIDTANILVLHPDLAASLIYLSEEIAYPMMKDDTPDFRKNIFIVLSRASLLAKAGMIKQQIEDLLLTISKETGLLQEDNLTRGQVVNGATVGARWEGEQSKGYWSWNYRECASGRPRERSSRVLGERRFNL